MVFITGASSGIGAGLAAELGGRGDAVGLIARRGDLLAQQVQTLRARGIVAAAATADVTDPEALGAAVRQLEAELGPCEVMIANAGGGRASPATAVPVADTLDCMRLNYDGAVYSLGAVLPGMLARGSGHLVAISSVAAWRGLPGAGAYSAAKAAISTLLDAWRADLRPRGISVTVVHPGFVHTPMTARARHPLPFLLSTEAAARIIANAVDRRAARCDFPFRMRLLMGFATFIPDFLWARLPIPHPIKDPPQPETRGTLPGSRD